jgi:hypothetical protein
MFRSNYLATLEMGLGLALGALGLWGAATGRGEIREYLYFFAWYPYLLFLDGLLYRLQGRFWLWSRPRPVLQMFFWSVTIWLVFEALNLILKNWAYQGLTASGWLRWPGYVLAFATVVPGILLTAAVIQALGAWKGTQGRPLHLGRWHPASFMLGTALLVLPLVFPRYAFPLIWGAFIFLLDPWVELLGGPSLIARLAAGQPRQPLCLMAAGLFCGLWWESWNYLSTSRWVYIFPVWNFWKIFEMPLLGYLGFIPFALECQVMYNFFRALEDRLELTPRSRRWVYLGQVAFWLLMFAALDTWTVVSYQ